jgi:hypothetical protein
MFKIDSPINNSQTHKEKLKHIKQIGLKNNAILLTNEWSKASGKYIFQLGDGRKFSITATRINKVGWPKDIDKFINLQQGQFRTAEDSLKELSKIAKERGGELKSTSWHGNKHKYTFTTIVGEEFEMSASSIKRGGWKKGDGLISEPCCRQALEHLFSEKFPSTEKVLTKEIINRDRPLELDGYCDKLKIAFEYQGHSSHWDSNHPNYSHKTFLDQLKKNTCFSLGILLIQIPPFKESPTQWKSQVVLEHVYKAVINTYVEYNKPFPILNKDNFQIDLSKNSHAFKMLNQLQNIAKDNKAILLTEHWLGAKADYTFKTHDNIIFDINAEVLKIYGWPKDIGFYLKTPQSRLDELKLFIEKNGAALLDNKWKGPEAKYKIKLLYNNKEYHIVPASIYRIKWPTAEQFDRYYLTKEDKYNNFKQEVEKRGAILLEEKWLGSSSAHKIQLKNGDILSRSPLYFKKGGWDTITQEKYINKSVKEQFEFLQKMAIDNDAQLLEATWLGYDVKHKFKILSKNIIVDITPNTLIKYGWIKNIDTYLKRMESRKSNLKLNQDKQINLEKLRVIAKDNDGLLLSSEFINIKSKYLFSFEDGTQFQMSADKMFTRGWPKNQDIYMKITDHTTHIDLFNKLKKLAIENNAELLEKEWLGMKTLHQFKLQGKIIKKLPTDLFKHGWPQKILKTKHEKLEQLKKIAKENGGILISTEWQGIYERYKFSFSNGQEFEIIAKNLINNGWPKDPEKYLKLVASIKKKRIHSSSQD